MTLIEAAWVVFSGVSLGLAYVVGKMLIRWLPRMVGNIRERTMIRKPIHERWKVGLGFFSIVLLAALYSWVSYQQHITNATDTTIPSIPTIARTACKICTPDSLGDVWLWQDLKASFGRYSLGLLSGVVLSLCLGVMMGCFPVVEYFLLPLMNFRWLPPTAMLAVFFVMVGTGKEMFVTLIAVGVTPVLTSAVYQAAKFDVPMELINKAYTLGKTSTGIIFKVVLPQIYPRVIEAVRLQLGPAMVYLIAAELMMGDCGFGYRLRIQSRLLNMAVVYCYLIFLGITGFFMDNILSMIRRWLSPWFGKK